MRHPEQSPGPEHPSAPPDRPSAGADARDRLLAGLPAIERRLRLADVSTAVLEAGAGPPVILLHGPGEHAAKWLHVIPGLARTHRVIAPDLPGHGATEVIDGPLGAHRVLGWLDALVEATCRTPPALVGQILGGAIAARFAVERSGRLDRLVLVDSLGLAPFQPTPEFGLALAAFVAEPTEETHDRLWRLCALDLDRLRRRMGERWEWLRAYNLDRARAPGLQTAQRGLMEQFAMAAIPPADLARITVPTALIWGRHDLATPLPIAEAASARHGWPLVVIEDAADDPALEQPDAFLAALRGALGDLSPRPATVSTDAPATGERQRP
jgi:pimeloyl-ACP methyl ester carboxylesterase